jgi:uncharacterized protein with FMN-binding domain
MPGMLNTVAARGSNKKIANSLVAASSAAVLAVYGAGYARTRAAAARLDVKEAVRHPVATVRPKPEIRGEEAAAPASATPRPIRDVVASAEPVPPPANVSPGSGPVPEVPVVKLEPPAEAAAATPAPAAPGPPAPISPAPIWKDGTWLGWGYCRHGNIQASVVIEGGRIASAAIAQCLTRYSCDVIERLPPEVAQRQSPDVDTVSGATQSADAFYGAVADALNKAKWIAN